MTHAGGCIAYGLRPLRLLTPAVSGGGHEPSGSSREARGVAGRPDATASTLAGHPQAEGADGGGGR